MSEDVEDGENPINTYTRAEKSSHVLSQLLSLSSSNPGLLSFLPSLELSKIVSSVLSLSVDYSVVTNSVCDSASGNVMLRRVGSVPSMDRRSSPLDDGEVFRQASENMSLDLSHSIDFLYEKLNEPNPKTSADIDIHCDKGRETGMQLEDSDKTEFAFSGNGSEMFQGESIDPSTESSGIETIDVHEILKDEEASFFETTHLVDQLPLHKLSSAVDDSAEKEMEDKPTCKAAKLSTRSLSLDAITESIANDFLSMLELEERSVCYVSDGEPTSPREYLLQEFEKEALDYGNFALDIGEGADCASDIDEESNDFSFSSSSLGVKETKHEGKSQLLWKAKVLEDMENESLLRELDLNDSSSENSLYVCADGFGSPIEVPGDEGLVLASNWR